MSALQRNISKRHELDVGRQIVDIRPFGERAAEWLSIPMNLLVVLIPLSLFTLLYPVVCFITLPALIILLLVHRTVGQTMPIRYPHDGVDDKNKPGNGILYIGSVADPESPYENFKELWLSDDQLRMHMLILGSTGSGKSEALKSIFYNALSWSSGFFIADGKADNKLPTDVYNMVRSNGRDADLLFLNFLLAGKTPEQVRRSRRRRSNRLNPFSSADSDTIIQMGSNLLPKVEGEGKNWQEKALNLWRSVVTALCYKRDTSLFDLNITSIIDYMSLHKVEELYLEGYRESLSRGDWSYGFTGIKSYLESGCPAYMIGKLLKKNGYDEADASKKPPASGRAAASGKDTEQDSQAHEQHAYRTNQLMPVLNLLDKTYGFVFREKYTEIDMSDVTLRNRILVMLIPSLEKSAAEAENLGKLAIACLRVMMSKNLGAEVEGSHEELLGSKATNSPYPYVVALDELAYYFSDGIAVMFAQARSLGTCMIAAAQDLEKLTEGNRASEAGAMLANQVTKFFMRIDDTGKTAEMVQKVVGKAKVAIRQSFNFGDTGYSRKTDVDIVEVDRVSTSKLQSFGQGEGIVNALGRTTFMRWFYMGQDIEKNRVKSYFVNRFLQVAPPSQEDIFANSIAVDALNDPYLKGEALLSKLKQEVAVDLRVPQDSMLQAVQARAQSLNPHLPAQERAIALYMAARQALLDEDAGTLATDNPPPAHKAPVSGFGEQHPIDSDPDSLDINIMSGIYPSLYKRKSAEEILGVTSTGDGAMVKAVSEDPFSLLVANASTMNFTDMKPYRGAGLAKIIGSPVVYDPLTELPLEPLDDWIGDSLKMSADFLLTPRSPDATVVGLTDIAMSQVQRVESLLNSPSPADAARSLERVVADKLTPDTSASESLDADDLDKFFSELESRVRG
jgi:intracellular multiplication protein IcmO